MMPGGKEGAKRTGGRSGNDFLVRGGEGHESWGAEGPSGTSGEGGYPGDGQFGGALTSSHAHASSLAGERERSGGSGLLTLLVGAGVGAALMYFLDAERGASRRQLVADKVSELVRSGQRKAQDVAGGLRARTRGVSGYDGPTAATTTETTLAATESTFSEENLEQPL